MKKLNRFASVTVLFVSSAYAAQSPALNCAVYGEIPAYGKFPAIATETKISIYESDSGLTGEVLVLDGQNSAQLESFFIYDLSWHKIDDSQASFSFSDRRSTDMGIPMQYSLLLAKSEITGGYDALLSRKTANETSWQQVSAGVLCHIQPSANVCR